jgi:hypothetical protein
MGPGGAEVDFWVFLVAFHWCIGPGGDEVAFWVFLVAFHRRMGPGGAEVDFWVFLVAFHWCIGPGGDEVAFWVFLVAFHRWMGPGGDEVDFWVFAGVQAGVPPVVLRRSLYTIYSTCLPQYNVVRPGASSHCERRPYHLRRAVRACCLRFRVVCVVCVISSVVCLVCVVLFPKLSTQRAMRISCPRSARCITAFHARS